ncbi:WecB/TagA/CpsF family glycosyltransferase [Niallia sp. 01092]|uniref:WecB/TagA/CpsF family glycosyltransferase n=1 Tax=unclassified Niallia TaxID=2837522 RepID=UPI003FD311A0
MMEKRWMGNILVNVVNTNDAIYYIDKRLSEKKSTDLYFLNDHCYNLAQEDSHYRDVINNGDLLLNDGIGIEVGAKLFGFRFKENLNGTDFIPALFQHLNSSHSQKYRIFLLGAKQGIAKDALKRLQQQYKQLEFVGEHHGYYDPNHSGAVIDDINNKKTDILLVGFGMPLQEKWIAENRSKLNCTLILAVGAFIDFSSGNVKRAPEMFRKLRLEWLYRMVKEPKRLWKRNLVGHAAFFYYVLKQKYKKKTVPDKMGS